jgi:hypothetical protein
MNPRCKGWAQESVGLENRRLQIDRSGPFLTVFLNHCGLWACKSGKKLSLLGPNFAFDDQSPTTSAFAKRRQLKQVSQHSVATGTRPQSCAASKSITNCWFAVAGRSACKNTPTLRMIGQSEVST